MDKIKVLYIDDELLNLAAFKASFRRTFEIFTAKSADEGKEILKNHQIEVILSDQRMPDKTGVDFFEEIIDIYPTPMRILITAYSDIESIIAAINKGNVYRYVTKPWVNYELQITIENAYEIYRLKEQNNNLNLKYKKVFSDSSDPIVLLDEKYQITDHNPATLSLINCENKNIESISFKAFFDNEHELPTIIDHLKEKNKLENFECELITLNGDKKECLISGNVITNNHNEIINYQLIIKDITKRNKLNQLLLEKIIETQEFERERISRDLHDGIGQSIAALKFHWESLKNSYNRNEDIGTELHTIPILLHETISELRAVCFNTLPLVLQEYGLIKAIEQIQINVNHSDFNIVFKHNEQLPIITKSLEISVFRIIQEFINNSLKHSGATEVLIEFKRVEDKIILNLKDNGIGFNVNNITFFKGHGLKNINNRIESIKGRLEITSNANVGTEFHIDFPIRLN